MALRQATPIGRDGGEGLARLIARYTRTGYVAVGAVFVLLLLSSWYVLTAVKDDVRREAVTSAQRATRLSHQGLSLWLDVLHRRAQQLTGTPRLVDWLAHAPQSGEAPEAVQRAIAASPGPLVPRAAAIVARDGTVLAVSGAKTPGAITQLLQTQGARFTRLVDGNVQLMGEGNDVALAVPLRHSERGVLGGLLLWPQFAGVVAELTHAGAPANGVTTYIFDATGAVFGPLEGEVGSPLGGVPSAPTRLAQQSEPYVRTYANEAGTAIVETAVWKAGPGLGVLRRVSQPRTQASYYHIRNLVGIIFVIAVVLALLLLLLLVRFRRRVEYLSKISSLDPLTQLANRRRFDTEVAEQWQIATRSKLPVSLILIDVDCFKAYNDHYGHQAGDACLRSIAKTLAACVKRSQDLVARYGGEEFAVLLPMTTAGSARIIAEHIQRRIAALHIEHQTSTVAEVVTVSMGVATMPARARTDASTLIERADELLYLAKENGRNRIVDTLEN